MADTVLRDYSVSEKNCAKAAANGLANAPWYRSPLPRPRLKELMQRSDGPAIRDTIIWIAAFIVTGVGGYLLPGARGGRCPSSSSTACSTAPRPIRAGTNAAIGTAFKTRVDERRRLPDRLASWCCASPTVWRWSHTRHHTDTIIVGRDPEIAVHAPAEALGRSA